MGTIEITERLELILPQVHSSAKKAYKDPPHSISPNAGPCWVTLPGPERKDFELSGRFTAFIGPQQGAYLSVRTYKVHLFVGTLGSGGAGEMSAKCKPVIDAFGPYFLGRPTLSEPDLDLAGLRWIWKSTPGDDTGVTGIDWAGIAYIGVIFELEIEELIIYDIAAHE